MFQLNSWIPLLSASSRLAVRNARRAPPPTLERQPKDAAAPEDTATTNSRLISAVEVGFWHPALGANASPKVTHLFCRLPLVTFTPLTRGYSPRSPDAVFGTVCVLGKR